MTDFKKMLEEDQRGREGGINNQQKDLGQQLPPGVPIRWGETPVPAGYHMAGMGVEPTFEEKQRQKNKETL